MILNSSSKGIFIEETYTFTSHLPYRQIARRINFGQISEIVDIRKIILKYVCYL